LAPPTVPEPLVTEHVCAGPVGCVATLTLYELPLAIGAANMKFRLAAVIVRLLPPFNCTTKPVPVKPVTVPLTR